MSRTDKTKPYHIKMCQGLIQAQEVHNHEQGSCDLPPLNAGSANRRTTRCYWAGDNSSNMARCGCNLCTGHFQRKFNTKRNRRSVKNQMRNWSRDPESYNEEAVRIKKEIW